MTPTVKHKARKGEVRIKEWVYTEAERTGKKPSSVQTDLCRGKYKHRVKVRKVNYQVGFVKEKKQ